MTMKRRSLLYAISIMMMVHSSIIVGCIPFIPRTRRYTPFPIIQDQQDVINSYYYKSFVLLRGGYSGVDSAEDEEDPWVDQIRRTQAFYSSYTPKSISYSKKILIDGKSSSTTPSDSEESSVVVEDERVFGNSQLSVNDEEHRGDVSNNIESIQQLHEENIDIKVDYDDTEGKENEATNEQYKEIEANNEQYKEIEANNEQYEADIQGEADSYCKESSSQDDSDIYQQADEESNPVADSLDDISIQADEVIPNSNGNTKNQDESNTEENEEIVDATQEDDNEVIENKSQEDNFDESMQIIDDEVKQPDVPAVSVDENEVPQEDNTDESHLADEVDAQHQPSVVANSEQPKVHLDEDSIDGAASREVSVSYDDVDINDADLVLSHEHERATRATVSKKDATASLTNKNTKRIVALSLGTALSLFFSKLLSTHDNKKNDISNVTSRAKVSLSTEEKEDDDELNDEQDTVAGSTECDLDRTWLDKLLRKPFRPYNLRMN